METTTKKQNRKKIVIGVLIAVVVLVAAVIAFASNYLVNYAIGRSGDGGDREVALDVDAPKDGVEQLIAENRAAQKQANEKFLQQNPGQTVQITAADGLLLNGVYYPNAGSHLWVIALHGYRGSHTGVTNLAQHYHDAGYQVLTPDLRACGDSEGDCAAMDRLGAGPGQRSKNCAARRFHGRCHHHDDGGGEHPRPGKGVCGGLRLHQRVGYFFQRAETAVRPAGIPDPVHCQRHGKGQGGL